MLYHYVQCSGSIFYFLAVAFFGVFDFFAADGLAALFAAFLGALAAAVVEPVEAAVALDDFEASEDDAAGAAAGLAFDFDAAPVAFFLGDAAFFFGDFALAPAAALGLAAALAFGFGAEIRQEDAYAIVALE
jgi:hypothetical protein